MINTNLAVENNGSGSRCILQQSKDLVKAFFIGSLVLIDWDPDSLNLGILKTQRIISVTKNI